MTVVFFIYGLAFFSLALALAVRGVPSDLIALRTPLYFLAGFGFIHGIAEWTIMAELLTAGETRTTLAAAAKTLGGLSFIILSLSAFHLFLDSRRRTHLFFGSYIALVSLSWAALVVGAWGGVRQGSPKPTSPGDGLSARHPH